MRALQGLTCPALEGQRMLGSPTPAYVAGETVALFVPCYVDVLFPDVAKATVEVLERLGVRVDYPEDQTCCGQPAYNAGRWEEARRLATRFADVFAGYRWIVVPSGSCGAMARAFFKTLDPDGPAARVGRSVFDLATFLVEAMGREDVGASFPHAVTYHDGCHGRRELHCTDATVRLLRAVKGLEYRALSHIDECCGFGGLFSVKYAELSSSMGEAKCADAASTGAEYLISGDASCLMHVGGMLARAHRPMKTLHLAEVLAHT